MMYRKEQTFVLVKTDGVCKRLIGEVIKRLESEEFKIVAMKMIKPDKSKIEEFYAPHKGEPFFPGLIKFMLTSPCVAMVAEGENIVRRVRELIGERIPTEAHPGSIRCDFGSDGRRNIVHASDSITSAKREINCFFSPEEVFAYHEDDWLDSEPG